jgi:hypothetical protein
LEGRIGQNTSAFTGSRKTGKGNQGCPGVYLNKTLFMAPGHWIMTGAYFIINYSKTKWRESAILSCVY